MKITRRQLRQIIRESIDRSYPTGPLETLPPLDSVDPGDFTPEPDYLDGWNDAAAGKGYREDASDAYFDGYRDGNDHMLRYDEPPMLEAKFPSRRRMKELKDTAAKAVSKRLTFPPYRVRIVPHQNLSARHRVEPEFEDQIMMRVYVTDRSGRNPVYDVVMSLASGRAEGVAKVEVE